MKKDYTITMLLLLSALIVNAQEWVFNTGEGQNWVPSNYKTNSFSATSWDLITPTVAQTALIQNSKATVNTVNYKAVVIRLKNTTPQTTARFYFRYGETSGRAFIPFNIDANMTGFKDFVINLADGVAFTGNGATLVEIGKKWTYDSADPKTQLSMSPLRFDLPSRMSPSQGVGTGSLDMLVSIESIKFLTTLPVELGNLQAQNNGSWVKLNWKTYSEINNKGFDILRCTDGLSFTKIGEVKGNTNSSKMINYSFSDFNPLQGTNYYRLKQIDLDGAFVLSDIAAVSISLSGNNKVYVTTVSDSRIKVDIRSNNTYTGTLSVTDLQGRVLARKKDISIEPGNNAIELECRLLAPGIYIATYTGTKIKLNGKFTVQ